MLELQRHISLIRKNTMALPATADYYCHASEESEIVSALDQARQLNIPLWILGGGSNVIFTGDFKGLVLHVGLKGIACLEENKDAYIVRAKAGENWDDFLSCCLQQGWHGLDNLAIIPGTVGASPVQNIGAYGQEVSDCIVQVQGIDIVDNKFITLTKAQCEFGYRDSIFKRGLKGRFIITAVDFRFDKKSKVTLDYAPLKQHFSGTTPSFSQVRQAVINIRQSKLPSPDKLANCGSFFKSPVVDKKTCQALLRSDPDMPYFDWQGETKLAAGWLIEQCGFKGKQLGPVGIYQQHALIVVNYGGATYQQLDTLVEQVQDSVKRRFGILLEQEPVEVCDHYRLG